MWNFPIQTDHQVINNNPDIIVMDKINETADLIDYKVTTTSAINFSKKYEYMQICQVKLRHSGI